MYTQFCWCKKYGICIHDYCCSVLLYVHTGVFPCHFPTTVVTKHTKLDPSAAGKSLFRFLGTLGDETSDAVILVRA